MGWGAATVGLLGGWLYPPLLILPTIAGILSLAAAFILWWVAPRPGLVRKPRILAVVSWCAFGAFLLVWMSPSWAKLSMTAFGLLLFATAVAGFLFLAERAWAYRMDLHVEALLGVTGSAAAFFAFLFWSPWILAAGWLSLVGLACLPMHKGTRIAILAGVVPLSLATANFALEAWPRRFLGAAVFLLALLAIRGAWAHLPDRTSAWLPCPR